MQNQEYQFKCMYCNTQTRKILNSLHPCGEKPKLAVFGSLPGHEAIGKMICDICKNALGITIKGHEDSLYAICWEAFKPSLPKEPEETHEEGLSAARIIQECKHQSSSWELLSIHPEDNTPKLWIYGRSPGEAVFKRALCIECERFLGITNNSIEVLCWDAFQPVLDEKDASFIDALKDGIEKHPLVAFSVLGDWLNRPFSNKKQREGQPESSEGTKRRRIDD